MPIRRQDIQHQLTIGNRPGNENTGLLEHQIQTCHNRDRVWQNNMIWRIRITLEARIAKEREKQVDRTSGYSNDEEAFRREFGIKPAPYEGESAACVAVEGGGIVDTML